MSSETPTLDDGRCSSKKPRKSAAGRKLIRWNPDLDQLVLLCVDSVCAKEGVPLPWDLIAQQVEPYLTGEAIKQHLAKLRVAREANGQRVPEKLDRSIRRANIGKLGGGAATGTAKGRGRKAMHDEDDDEELMPAGKNAGLLWMNPKELEKKFKKKAAVAVPKTPRNKGKKIKSESESDDEGGTTANTPNPQFVTPITAKTKTTTGVKRARSTKTATKQETDDQDVLYTPTAKPMVTAASLRALPDINYAEPALTDGDDEAELLQDAGGEYEPYPEDEGAHRKKAKMTPDKHVSFFSSVDPGNSTAPPPAYATPANEPFFQVPVNDNDNRPNGYGRLTASPAQYTLNPLVADDVFAPNIHTHLGSSGLGLDQLGGYDGGSFGGQARQESALFGADGSWSAGAAHAVGATRTTTYDGLHRDFSNIFNQENAGSHHDVGGHPTMFGLQNNFNKDNTFSFQHTANLPLHINTNLNFQTPHGLPTPRSFSTSTNNSQSFKDSNTISPAADQLGKFSFDSSYASANDSSTHLINSQAGPGVDMGLPDTSREWDLSKYEHEEAGDGDHFHGFLEMGGEY